MNNFLSTATFLTLICIFFLSITTAFSQDCSYTLDFKDETTYQVDCFLPTGSSHVSASQWEVKGTNQGPANCALEANLDLSDCAKSDLIVDFLLNQTGSLAPGDFVSLQINTDRRPIWTDVLFLDDIHLNSLNSNISSHEYHLSADLFDDMATLRVRLMVYSTGNGSPIKIKDGDFKVQFPSATLPLDLISFKALSENSNVKLSWETAQEENVSHFELERSFNAEEWTNILFLNAQNTGAASYKYQDVPRTNGTIYYRLKMVDQDETNTYSEIITTRIDRSELAIFPNPANDQITVSTLDEGQTVQIYTLMGQLVKQEISSNKLSTLDISDLPTGNYLFKVGNETKRITKIK